MATIAGSAMPRIERYVELLVEENCRQNLIARSTEAQVWGRHILDSAQLAAHARAEDRFLLDIGSGAGLPGIVLALLGRWQVTLVEPRRKRAEFLMNLRSTLRLDHVEVVVAGVEAVARHADLITARAVAPAAEIFRLAVDCFDRQTRFILPKGRSAQADVDLAKRHWHGVFHVEQSATDPDAGIVIADRVSRR